MAHPQAENTLGGWREGGGGAGEFALRGLWKAVHDERTPAQRHGEKEKVSDGSHWQMTLGVKSGEAKDGEGGGREEEGHQDGHAVRERQQVTGVYFL
jgi:hypothetical protein